MLLVFWSTNCGSCLAILPELNKLHSELGPAVEVVGFPLQPDADLAACVVSRKGVLWPQIRGEEGDLINPLAETLGILKVPSLWIVDGNEVIRAAGLGRVEEVRACLADVMAGRR